MYSLAKQLAGRMKAIMEIESEIAEAERESEHQGEKLVRDLEQKRSDLIKTFSRDELLVIKTVMKVGRSERGYRYHFNSNEIEIIHLPIELNNHELMQKYSYYLVHKTKQELAHGIEYYTAVSEQLKEGMEILKL
ncbi:hypothetical protein QP794_29835 [Paenibacillus sp. UMB7766-LJ446]|uniref:hypothetical protein n=1 Tax=Paenibacillus sp. UMB7766-LJ446 TaxID=3046313 RepID=UPI00255051E2|nr:hypothetical protein [Paenibacillus sp. UMB7766-LJ446]MDK8194285.1 hypothetical protein [Paenibacillus sp. UMB7766-LJ446]